MTDGIRFVEKGQGATAAELLDALIEMKGNADIDLREASVWRHVLCLKANYKTNIGFTGKLLTEADLERIARCE